MSNIKQELLDSYTEANYHVYANPSFILKIVFKGGHFASIIYRLFD